MYKHNLSIRLLITIMIIIFIFNENKEDNNLYLVKLSCVVTMNFSGEKNSIYKHIERFMLSNEIKTLET